ARIYSHLFAVERPMDVPPSGSFLDNLSPNSVEVLEGFGEACLVGSQGIGDRGQGTVSSESKPGTNADSNVHSDIPDENLPPTPYPLPPKTGIPNKNPPTTHYPLPTNYYQFERQGYFVRDPDVGRDGRAVFNKTAGLRDTWAKVQKK
ncbi:MAG: hypothetical protein LBG72_03620, partial [Spirochaetaceae bacterium]|nr:hypothetical protein [Spirochaetaceae bacterium]